MKELIIHAKSDKGAKLEVLLKFEPLIKKTRNVAKVARPKHPYHRPNPARTCHSFIVLS